MTPRRQIDLDHWRWMEKHDTSPGVRYITPRSDPHLHEQPYDLLWPSMASAIADRDQLVSEERDCGCGIDRDDDCDDADHEPHEAETWVLIHYLGTIET